MYFLYIYIRYIKYIFIRIKILGIHIYFLYIEKRRGLYIYIHFKQKDFINFLTQPFSQLFFKINLEFSWSG